MENIFQSAFVLKGFKFEDKYYIVKRKNNNFDVFQLLCESNSHMTASDIKIGLPHLKEVPNDKVKISIPTEKFPAVLLLEDIDIWEMNSFRITLDNEEILTK